MKQKNFSLTALTLFLTLAFAPLGQARGLGIEMQGTIQTVNLETKHATMLTKEGTIIAFRWSETAKFTPSVALHKGLYVKVEYHHLLVGESYVNSVTAVNAKK